MADTFKEFEAELADGMDDLFALMTRGDHVNALELIMTQKKTLLAWFDKMSVVDL